MSSLGGFPAFIRRQTAFFLLIAISVLIVSSSNLPSPLAQNRENKTEMAGVEFRKLAAEYLDDLHSRHPSLAAASGIHAWDGRLDDLSGPAVVEEVAAIKRFHQRLEKIQPLSLSFSELFDYQILASSMKARLLELEQIRNYKRNPQVYSDVISNGLLLISMFEYAPADSRLRHIVAKEKQVPALIDAARANVTDPPAIFLKTALASFKGTLTFVEKDLPRAFASAGDAKLRSEFDKTTRRAAKAISGYIKHLERVKPDPAATFALGKLHYEAKLKYEEGIDVPVDTLLRIAQRELSRTQEQFRKTAAQIDSKRDPLRVWTDLQANHPKAGALVEEARNQLATLVRFVEEKKIVTLPPSPGPQVAPTPDFMRWATASMWTPGPFEARELPARYLITDVDAAWTEEQKREYLSSFNFPQLWSTSIHEAYPGHFVQGAYLKQVESPVRKTWALAPASFVEGWAHYTEQMMIEEGFGEGDPKLRMGQLADALLRLCRFVVGIRLHTDSMTVDQATRFFMENGYMAEVPARIEAERGTFDPTYVVYSVGKLAILKLREDYKRYRKDSFSLQEFHDHLLSNGLAPIWAHRQMLMPGDKGRLIE